MPGLELNLWTRIFTFKATYILWFPSKNQKQEQLTYQGTEDKGFCSHHSYHASVDSIYIFAEKGFKQIAVVIQTGQSALVSTGGTDLDSTFQLLPHNSDTE